MSKNIFFIIVLFFIAGNIALKAQEIFRISYSEWPDGCLTYQYNPHYQYNELKREREHRNDTAYVKNLINQFNNSIRQYNAVQYRQGQHNAGDYVYDITTWSGYGGPSKTEAGEPYTAYICSIFRIGGSSGSGTGTSGYSPANSNYLLIGYNFAYGLPIGLTIADSMFFERSLMYISANIGGFPDNFGIEWIYGASIAITDWLRIPVGIGANHTSIKTKIPSGGSWINGVLVEQYYQDSMEWKHKFVMEIGLQPVILDRFYLSTTYRLIGFSQSGFTIGAGIIF